MNNQNNPSASFFERFNKFLSESVTIKLIVIGLLMLVMLIPVNMIESLIQERAYRLSEAQGEIAQSWAGSQNIGGPVINLPYTDYDRELKARTEGILHILPDQFEVKTNIEPEIRYRGIFEVPVYQSVTEIDFSFQPQDLPAYSGRTYHYDRMRVLFGISDPRGITDVTSIEINGTETEFEPGVPDQDVFQSGISAPFHPGWSDSGTTAMSGHMSLKLRGSGSLYFLPIGKTSRVEVTSSWANPSFAGSFLPNNREVSASGFTADWSVLQYNRSTPQVFSGAHNLEADRFGVELFTPVNHYQKSERSAKYAVMLIALTFVLFFFSQAINKVHIHPFQYFLVGLALSLFYTLLLSLSEHIGFNMAYITAAVMILAMITLYMKQVFRSLKFTLITSAVLAGLYVYIFTLLQLQDYALLIGSIGLFIILALIMWLSLKINWGGKREETTEI